MTSFQQFGVIEQMILPSVDSHQNQIFGATSSSQSLNGIAAVISLVSDYDPVVPVSSSDDSGTDYTWLILAIVGGLVLIAIIVIIIVVLKRKRDERKDDAYINQVKTFLIKFSISYRDRLKNEFDCLSALFIAFKKTVIVVLTKTNKTRQSDWLKVFVFLFMIQSCERV